MHDILLQVEHLITKVSDAIWPVFLPFILVVGAIMAVRSIVIIQKKATEPAKLNIKNVIGPASISLGAMIGTGAIIGVLVTAAAFIFPRFKGYKAAFKIFSVKGHFLANGDYLIIGLLILVMALLMRYGYKYQSNSDMTI